VERNLKASDAALTEGGLLHDGESAGLGFVGIERDGKLAVRPFFDCDFVHMVFGGGFDGGFWMILLKEFFGILAIFSQ
jgi:hypothetical protein